MSNITEQTARRIAIAYQEIRSAEELLAVLDEAAEQYGEPDFRDNFGRVRGLQLGVPSGQNGHRLLDVRPRLARVIIENHVCDKKAELAALSILAQTELAGAEVPPRTDLPAPTVVAPLTAQ